MSISNSRIVESEPTAVQVTADALCIELADGRTISVPLQWYPRLLHGNSKEQSNYELSYDGIHWPDLNEDISVEGLLRGQKSGESPKSLGRWLKYRARGQKEPIPVLPLSANVERSLTRIGVLKAKRKGPTRRQPAGAR
jgi:hypothetical protein